MYNMISSSRRCAASSSSFARLYISLLRPTQCAMQLGHMPLAAVFSSWDVSRQRQRKRQRVAGCAAHRTTEQRARRASRVLMWLNVSHPSSQRIVPFACALVKPYAAASATAFEAVQNSINTSRLLALACINKRRGRVPPTTERRFVSFRSLYVRWMMAAFKLIFNQIQMSDARH